MESNSCQMNNYLRRFLPPDLADVSMPHQNVSLSFEDFQLTSIIGQGGYGRVFKANTQILKNKTEVALKQLRKFVDFEESEKEVKAMVECANPHLIAIHGAFFHAFPYMVLELAACNIMVYKPNVGEAVRILDDMLSGLDYLHQKRWLHVDLKPDNVLIAGGFAKIADLGAARRMKEGENYVVQRKLMGSFGYSTLDTLRTGVISPSTDIYAASVSVWECLYQEYFARPKNSKWLEIMLTDENIVNFFIKVHLYGRLVEKDPHFLPTHLDDFEGEEVVFSQREYTKFERVDLRTRFTSFTIPGSELMSVLTHLTGFYGEPPSSIGDFRKTPSYLRVLRDAQSKLSSLPQKSIPVNKPIGDKNPELFKMNPLSMEFSLRWFYKDPLVFKNSVERVSGAVPKQDPKALAPEIKVGAASAPKSLINVVYGIPDKLKMTPIVLLTDCCKNKMAGPGKNCNVSQGSKRKLVQDTHRNKKFRSGN